MRRNITRGLALIAVLIITAVAYAKNRDPKDYPQKATVVSFERQPCIRQVAGHTRVCHVITFEVDGQTLTGSCFRCDPLMPGETYPARLDRKELVLYIIHQKEKGNWGQDDLNSSIWKMRRRLRKLNTRTWSGENRDSEQR